MLLRDGRGYLLAVLPASRQLDQAVLSRLVDRPVELATENETETIFRDCAPGAVPAIGPAYGLETVIDDRLMAEPEIYFEGSDHESLVHMRGEVFQELVRDVRHGSFAPPDDATGARVAEMPGRLSGVSASAQCRPLATVFSPRFPGRRRARPNSVACPSSERKGPSLRLRLRHVALVELSLQLSAQGRDRVLICCNRRWTRAADQILASVGRFCERILAAQAAAMKLASEAAY